jgi:Domain of Unknown Function (DUF1259)
MPKRDVVLATLMSDKKTVFLLPTGLALVICTIALVGSISPAVYGQQQGTTGGQTGSTIDCQTAASTLGGIVIPNPTGACDVAVPRQGLQVQDTATGATLNNLLVINPLFEFTPTSNQAATGAANQTMVYGFAEFAMMEGELTSAMRMLSNSSWNVVAVHNHVIGESPSMIFAHAIANGDINTLVRDARMILDGLMTQTQSQSQSGNQTTTTPGGMVGNATTTGDGGTTTGGNINSSPSADSLTGGTTTGEGATAGGGVGTFGGGSGTGPGPGIGTTNGTGGGGQQQQQGGGESGTTTTTTDGTGGGGDGTTGGAAGPQVRP